MAAKLVASQPLSWAVLAATALMTAMLATLYFAVTHQHAHMGHEVAAIREAVDHLKSSQAVLKSEIKQIEQAK